MLLHLLSGSARPDDAVDAEATLHAPTMLAAAEAFRL